MVTIHIETSFTNDLIGQEKHPLIDKIKKELEKKAKEILIDETRRDFFYLHRFRQIEITLSDDKQLSNIVADYQPILDKRLSDTAKIRFNCVHIWHRYHSSSSKIIANFVVEKEILESLYHEFTHAVRFLVNEHVYEVHRNHTVQSKHLEKCLKEKKVEDLEKTFYEFFISTLNYFFFIIVEEGFTTLSETGKFKEILLKDLPYNTRELRRLHVNAKRGARQISHKIKKFYKEFDKVCLSKDLEKLASLIDKNWIFSSTRNFGRAQYDIGVYLLVQIMLRTELSYKELFHMNYMEFLEEYDNIFPKTKKHIGSRPITRLDYKIFPKPFLSYPKIKDKFVERIHQLSKELQL